MAFKINELIIVFFQFYKPEMLFFCVLIERIFWNWLKYILFCTNYILIINPLHKRFFPDKFSEQIGPTN